jgi:hypothetical protein
VVKYVPERDVKLVDFEAVSLGGNKVLEAGIYSYDGGTPKLRVVLKSGKFTIRMLKSGQAELAQLASIITTALAHWPVTPGPVVTPEKPAAKSRGRKSA